jgi:DNA-directed RNA polymerase subunit RPC12/RpoP
MSKERIILTDGVMDISGKTDPFYLKCEYCMEHFHAMDAIIENDGLHCPYCGSIMAQVQAHVSQRGK